MATKENIKQLYTEDGKTKIYPVVISDSLTTDDGKTTGADAIGKWLADAHIYAKNLTVSADPSVMNSTDRLALYRFVETQGNAGGQTMTINMPLTIGVNTETETGNKNGNIIINNVTTSINSSSEVNFRGDKTVMNLSDVSNGWSGSTFTKQSGLIINSKNTNNAPSLVIGNRDIFTIDVNGGVGLFGDGWFNADANYEPAGKALCLQDKGGDVKIGGNLLVNGNEKINGKVKICDKHAYFSIFADGTINKNKITMQMNGEDAVVMSNYGGSVLDIKRTLLAENMAYLSDGGESIVSLAASSYAKIDYINLGKTTNSKINDPNNWSNVTIGDEIVRPMMKAASITPPGGIIPGVGGGTKPYHLIIDSKKYTFSTAGKTWDSSGIVSSANHIAAINNKQQITPLYLNYPTGDVHSGVSVYDLSVKNKINIFNDNYYISGDASGINIKANKVVFDGAVKVKDDNNEVNLSCPIGMIVDWYNGTAPDGWETLPINIYYIGYVIGNHTTDYVNKNIAMYEGDIQITTGDDKGKWHRSYDLIKNHTIQSKRDNNNNIYIVGSGNSKAYMCNLIFSYNFNGQPRTYFFCVTDNNNADTISYSSVYTNALKRHMIMDISTATLTSTSLGFKIGESYNTFGGYCQLFDYNNIFRERIYNKIIKVE